MRATLTKVRLYDQPLALTKQEAKQLKVLGGPERELDEIVSDTLSANVCQVLIPHNRLVSHGRQGRIGLRDVQCVPH